MEKDRRAKAGKRQFKAIWWQYYVYYYTTTITKPFFLSLSSLVMASSQDGCWRVVLVKTMSQFVLWKRSLFWPRESSLFVNVSPEKIRICCGIFSSVSLTKNQTMARVVLVLNNVFRHSSFCFLMIFSDINFLEDFQINYLDQYSYLKEFFLNFRILTWMLLSSQI